MYVHVHFVEGHMGYQDVFYNKCPHSQAFMASDHNNIFSMPVACVCLCVYSHKWSYTYSKPGITKTWACAWWKCASALLDIFTWHIYIYIYIYTHTYICLSEECGFSYKCKHANTYGHHTHKYHVMCKEIIVYACMHAHGWLFLIKKRTYYTDLLRECVPLLA
jgi:hypothetical protein